MIYLKLHVYIAWHNTHSRACVSKGVRGAWFPQNFWTSRLVPADFEVLTTTLHPHALFYETDSSTRSFKFLTQALHSTFRSSLCNT